MLEGDNMSIRNVFEQITSFENLLIAEKDSAASKRYTNEVLSFRYDYEDNILDIREALINLQPPETIFRSFYVYEPKIRKVIFVDYKTKIIQRALYNVLNPLVCKGFITDTYSCVKGRGQLKAMQRLYGWMKYVNNSGKKWYYLKMDIEKFFYRMDHDVLISILEKKIGDKRTLKLLKHYISDSSIPFGLPLGIKSPLEIRQSDMLWDKGIPIGGGLSHMFGNMYLDKLDQECKRNLSIHYYIRYMDDVIILSDSKEQLWQWKHHIEDFLMKELKLNLNKKTAIRPISQGVEFVGYRIWPTHVTLRKSTSLRMKRRLKVLRVKYRDYQISLDKVFQTIASYTAMMHQCNCKLLEKKILDEYVLTHNREDI